MPLYPQYIIIGFNFGVRQNGKRVGDVELPKWCNGDARLFILGHRAALEADIVREVLSYWIDLVFGFRQTGKSAVEAINVFHPAVCCLHLSDREIVFQSLLIIYYLHLDLLWIQCGTNSGPFRTAGLGNYGTNVWSNPRTVIQGCSSTANSKFE